MDPEVKPPVVARPVTPPVAPAVEDGASEPSEPGGVPPRPPVPAPAPSSSRPGEPGIPAAPSSAPPLEAAPSPPSHVPSAAGEPGRESLRPSPASDTAPARDTVQGAAQGGGGSPGGDGTGATAGRPGGDLALATPGSGGDAGVYAEYLAGLRRRIQESLSYPSMARRRGLAGTVQLEVEIAPTGAVVDVKVVGSSSHAVLDAAAVETVRDLRRVPFPSGVPPRRLRVRLPVVFALR